MKIVDKRLRETADVINKKFAKVNEKTEARCREKFYLI